MITARSPSQNRWVIVLTGAWPSSEYIFILGLGPEHPCVCHVPIG